MLKNFITVCAVFVLPGIIIAGNILEGDSSFETSVGDKIVSSANGIVKWELNSDTAWDGKQSVKLNFPSGDWCQSKPFCIIAEEDGKTFTFSVYAKSEREGVPARLYMIQQNWSHGIHGQEFKLTKEWKRYSISGRLKNGHYWLGFGTNVPSVIWMDAFQFERGEKPSDYINCDMAIGISVPYAYDNVFFEGEKIPVSFMGIDLKNDGSRKDLTHSFTISDYSCKTVEKKRQVIVPENGKFNFKYEFVPPGLGWFLIRAELKNHEKTLATASGAICVVAPPVEIRKGRVPFCGTVGTYMAGLERIGNHWMEVCTHWKDSEAVQGKYTWKDCSWMHRGDMKARLVVAHFPSVPKWAWDPQDVADCKEMKMPVPSSGFLPAKEHLESWRKFIHELVLHYKGQLDIIEIGGEDDLTFGGNSYYRSKFPKNTKCGQLVSGPAYDRYSEMIRIACEEIRKTDPNQKIGIVRPSGWDCSDVSPKYSFSAATIKNCRRLFDLFPLDCYCQPRYIGPGLSLPAFPEDFLPDSLNGALDICQNNGNGQNVYIAEFGYALDYNVEPDSSYAMEMVKRLARSYLVARMIPRVESLHWFHTNGCIEGGKYHYGLWRFGMPMATVAAYSAVARIVENVELSKELVLGGDSKAVVFKKAGRADAAVWFVRGNGKLKLNNMPEGLVITDVMGNKLYPLNTIDLDEFPIYFGMKGDDAFDKLSGILSQSEMICKPVRLSFYTPRNDKGILQLKNIAGKDIDTIVTIDKIDRHVFLKNGQRTNIEIPINKNKVEVSADSGNDYEKVNASYPVAFESCPKVGFKVKIDGDLSEWDDLPFIAMNQRSQIMPPDPWVEWRGPEQFSAKVYTGWDGKYFYMAAEVKDKTHSNRFSGEIYKGDCIQFAFDPLADSLRSRYGVDDKEMGMALVGGKPAFVQWVGQGIWNDCEYAVKRDDKEKKTFYEIRIPLASLGIPLEKGSAFGFNFVIFNDDTGAGSNYYYQFAPGITGGKNPAVFKKFVLE